MLSFFTSTHSIASETVQTKPLELTDIMHFNSLQKPVLADNGAVMAVEAMPDRGDSHVIIKYTDGSKSWQIDLGSSPAINRDGQFVIATLASSLLDKETKNKS